MSNEKFHIGRQIERVIAERRMMKCVLANKLGVSESTVMHLKNRETVDAQMLQRIGNVLQYNFFKHYPVEEVAQAGGAQADACARGEGTEGTTGTKAVDKDRVIAEQGARIAELEKQVEEMKRLEMTLMKRGYEDLRQANEMLMASLKTGASIRQGKVVRRNLFG